MTAMQGQGQQQAADADQNDRQGQGQPQGQADGQQGQTDADKDWKAEYEAQQRINRDIERRNGKRLKELEQELAAAKVVKPASVTDQAAAPDIETIRQQLRDETRSETLKDRALDKLEVQAARMFKNPDDARAFLAANVEEFVTDGKVDTEAIKDALADLLKKRPYLGVDKEDPKRFNGTADAGARGTTGKPQLTDAQVKEMYAKRQYAEIEQARIEGLLNDVLGIK